MDVRFLTTAQIELDESFDFYEEQIEGLGYDFIMEVLATVKRIKNNPEAWTQLSARTRRCLINRFPFGIIYQVRDNEVLIVAIAHLHRKPGYWKNRI